MAEYLIQSETLDDIANAINAKTGGSSAMTPAQMVTAIGTISGGGDPWELIVDYTSNGVASYVKCEIPLEYQNENVYKIEIDGTFNKADWLWLVANDKNSANYSGQTSSVHATSFVVRGTANNSISGSFCLVGWGGTGANGTYPLVSVGSRSYYNDDRINSGFRIKVWRLIES